MSVVAQPLKGLGGGGGKAACIDTEGTFRPKRITRLAERFGVNLSSGPWAWALVAFAKSRPSPGLIHGPG